MSDYSEIVHDLEISCHVAEKLFTHYMENEKALSTFNDKENAEEFGRNLAFAYLSFIKTLSTGK